MLIVAMVLTIGGVGWTGWLALRDLDRLESAHRPGPRMEPAATL